MEELVAGILCSKNDAKLGLFRGNTASAFLRFALELPAEWCRSGLLRRAAARSLCNDVLGCLWKVGVQRGRTFGKGTFSGRYRFYLLMATTGDREGSGLKATRLVRMQRLALGLLGLMCVVFVAARLGARSVPWLHWVEAFAEAAMVGALADWFAVVALFRHPLGLPIPHTAILPTRKAEISKTLGLFVADNFLGRGVVEARLARVDLVALATGWMRANAGEVARVICGWVPRLLDSLKQEEVAGFIHRQLQTHLSALPLAPITGRVLGMLTSGGKHEVLLDEVLQQADRLLVEHAQSVQDSIEREVPLPDDVLGISLKGFKQPVAEWIAEKLISKVQALIRSAGSDREHPVRRRFTVRVEQLVADLQGSPEYFQKGEEIKRELLSNPALAGYAGKVWEEFQRWLLEQAQPGGAMRGKIEAFVLEAADSLEKDAPVAGRLNAWLRTSLAGLVEKHRYGVGEMIEETVNAWDAGEMSRKLELEVGADLQFIRINGTLIGGLVGLLIHAVSQLLS